MNYQTLTQYGSFIELDVTNEASEALSQNNWKYIHDQAENKYYVLNYH